MEIQVGREARGTILLVRQHRQRESWLVGRWFDRTLEIVTRLHTVIMNVPTIAALNKAAMHRRTPKGSSVFQHTSSGYDGSRFISGPANSPTIGWHQTLPSPHSAAHA